MAEGSCLACDLASGAAELPGGRITRTDHWVVEHCVGPLGVGTLIVKPLRHVLTVAELTEDEASELGPLLRRVSAAIAEESAADQVYVCLWSHANWEPVHIHFVLQPSWKHLHERYPFPGPTLQSEMFLAGELPDRAEVETYCDKMRAKLAT